MSSLKLIKTAGPGGGSDLAHWKVVSVGFKSGAGNLSTRTETRFLGASVDPEKAVLRSVSR